MVTSEVLLRSVACAWMTEELEALATRLWCRLLPSWPGLKPMTSHVVHHHDRILVCLGEGSNLEGLEELCADHVAAAPLPAGDAGMQFGRVLLLRLAQQHLARMQLLSGAVVPQPLVSTVLDTGATSSSPHTHADAPIPNDEVIRVSCNSATGAECNALRQSVVSTLRCALLRRLSEALPWVASHDAVPSCALTSNPADDADELSNSMFSATEVVRLRLEMRAYQRLASEHSKRAHTIQDSDSRHAYYDGGYGGGDAHNDPSILESLFSELLSIVHEHPMQWVIPSLCSLEQALVTHSFCMICKTNYLIS